MAAESGMEAAAVSGASELTGSVRVPEYTSSAAQDVESVLAASEPGSEAAPAADGALLETLFAEPHSFEFFQAVRLLQRLRDDRATVGDFADPRDEVVRFQSATSVAFPASEVQALERPSDGPPRMTVNFLGLTGPQGMLPLVYSHYLGARARAGDHALREFLGIFDHRILSLFYRAWEKSHVAVALERGEGRRDWLTRHLLDIAGVGTDGLQARLPLPDSTLLYYAGLLAMPTRPASALEQLLGDYFDVPVAIEQFVGAWYPLERSNQSELGDEWSTSAQLGIGAVAGDEVWDQQSRVRVRVGPLTRRDYARFLPGGSAHAQLSALCRFFGNDQIDFDVQLVLARDEVPPCRLGAEDEPLPLGWSTWLRTRPLPRDPDDAVFTL